MLLQPYVYMPFRAWPNNSQLLKQAPALDALLRTVDFIGVGSQPIVPSTQSVRASDMEQSILQVTLQACNLFDSALAVVCWAGAADVCMEAGHGALPRGWSHAAPGCNATEFSAVRRQPESWLPWISTSPTSS